MKKKDAYNDDEFVHDVLDFIKLQNEYYEQLTKDYIKLQNKIHKAIDEIKNIDDEFYVNLSRKEKAIIDVLQILEEK